MLLDVGQWTKGHAQASVHCPFVGIPPLWLALTLAAILLACRPQDWTPDFPVSRAGNGIHPPFSDDLPAPPVGNWERTAATCLRSRAGVGV